MKRILEIIIQKRNPNFQFDPSITLWIVIRAIPGERLVYRKRLEKAATL